MGGWGDGGVLTYFWYSGLLQAKLNKMDIQNPKKKKKNDWNWGKSGKDNVGSFILEKNWKLFQFFW